MVDDDPTELVRLVALARRGDGPAFAALVRPHLPTMIRLACAVSGSATDAEDVVQESLTALFRSLRSFDENRPLAPWFARIVVNQARNSRRGRMRRRLLFEKAAQSTPSIVRTSTDTVELVLDPADGGRVLTALRSLSPDDQSVLALRHLAGLTEAETAIALHIAVGTVKSRSARALQRLRSIVEMADSDRPYVRTASTKGRK